ncbi:MAG: glycosyltransferase family 4 protein [Candidatus Omnitrophota bacterium]
MEKALIVTPFYKPNIGGGETFAEDLFWALSKKYKVGICTIKWDKQIIWQGMNLWKAFDLIKKLTPEVISKIRQNNYQKVYALGLISAFICWILGVKFSAIMLALYDFKKPHFLYTRILNAADKVFVEGNSGYEDMKSLGINDNKIILFQHWVDQNKFKYMPRNNEKMKVLFVGRPIKIKGKHIIKECENLTKDIIYEYIENVPYDLLASFYQSADVVVVPSLYSEGFSRVVVEAASCGCALLTSIRGALPELVKGFGIVIIPTPQRFALKLTELNNDRKRLFHLQLKSLKYSKEHFSEKNAEVFL